MIISILIPVYNSEKFLNNSISSVLNQTYHNLEIIAIDDGSTDNSLKILQKYSDKIILIHQENKGLADALNVGIKNMDLQAQKKFSHFLQLISHFRIFLMMMQFLQ